MTKTFTAKTMTELKAKIYAAHGWVRMAGESATVRIKSVYDLTLDAKRNLFIAKRKQECR